MYVHDGYDRWGKAIVIISHFIGNMVDGSARHDLVLIQTCRRGKGEGVIEIPGTPMSVLNLLIVTQQAA